MEGTVNLHNNMTAIATKLNPTTSQNPTITSVLSVTTQYPATNQPVLMKNAREKD